MSWLTCVGQMENYLNNPTLAGPMSSNTLDHEVRAVDPRSLRLDPENPRIPPQARETDQDALLSVVARRFKVDDLANSIAMRGFLNVDPIICYESDQLYVREGNRRVAALQLLLEPERAPEGQADLWKRLSEDANEHIDSLMEIDVWVVGDKDDADLLAYIGFRHVSGVLAWSSHEKAAYITYLVDRGLSYYEVGREIGSRRDAVERLYVAQRLVDQAHEEEVPGADKMQRNFGVLLRGLNAPGTREFLGLTYDGAPEAVEGPVPADRINCLHDFVRWTFGTDEHLPVLKESRDLTAWGKILSTPAAVAYLRQAPAPEFTIADAYRVGDLFASITVLEELADQVDALVLRAPDFLDEKGFWDAVEELGDAVGRLAAVGEQ